MSKFIVRKETQYTDYTLLTYYSKSLSKPVKKFMPFIDSADGYLKRLDLETGEICLYTREMIKKSKYCSINRSKIKLMTLLEMNTFDWFITLTFSPEIVDRMNDEEIYNEYRNFTRRLRYADEDVTYLTVVERHKSGGIHYHILVGNIHYNKLKLTYSGKVCCSWAKNGVIDELRYLKQSKEPNRQLKQTDGIPVFNVGLYYSGYSTATVIQDKARTNYYVMKYIKKALDSSVAYNKRRFYYSKNLELPEEKFILFKSRYNQLDYGYRIKGAEDILALVKKYDYNYLNNGYAKKNLEEMDVVQFRIDSVTKKMIDSGFIPIDDDEIDFGDEIQTCMKI